jgi:hypothetical protein
MSVACVGTMSKPKLTQTEVREIFAKHLNAALKEIQDKIGQTDGGPCSQSHDVWDNLEADFAHDARHYLRSECQAFGWTYAESE